MIRGTTHLGSGRELPAPHPLRLRPAAENGPATRSPARTCCCSDKRLLVWGARGKLIDVPFADERIAAIEVAAEEPEKAMFAWEASLFHDNRSGRVEVRLHPVAAGQIVALVKR